MLSFVRGSKFLGTPALVNKVRSTSSSSSSSQNHPDLENLYFINRLDNNERIYPNGQPIAIENEYFKGKMLVMIRTSDADQKTEPGGRIHTTTRNNGTPSNDKVSNYLRSKMRRFEIQLQVKFKKIPTSRVYLSCGYDEPVKLGFLQLASLNAALKFCQRRNPSFSYSLNGKELCTDEEQQLGLHEDPHFAFPIETSLDRIVVTKPYEEPPKLGSDINEDKEAYLKRLKYGKPTKFNLDDTYTICLWNSNVDFVSWKAMNLPFPRFSLTHVNNSQPMIVKLYSLGSDNNGRQHLKKDMKPIIDIEVSHKSITSMGIGAQTYLQQRTKTTNDTIVHSRARITME